MHLLLAQPGEVTDGSGAVDLGQTPADVIVISAADTELAALAEARSMMEAAPDLRLASLMHLTHPMSVDLYLDQTALKSKLVIAVHSNAPAPVQSDYSKHLQEVVKAVRGVLEEVVTIGAGAR